MKSGEKRARCLSCNSPMIRWGKTLKGKIRYRCSFCKTSRLYRKNIIDSQDFRLFTQYVLWGATYQMLAAISGKSVRQLEREFHRIFADTPPSFPPLDQSTQEKAYLLIDGLWFGRWFVLMVYRQSKNLMILHISVAGKEVSTKISKDLLFLKHTYPFTGIVSDGQTGIVKAVHEVYPHIPHQLCLAHMHRDITAALGQKSKDSRIRSLRLLADWVWKIESKEALAWWIQQIDQWYWHHWQFLMETRKDADTGKRWYIHTGARKAFRMLKRLPFSSFVFLDHPTMPKTTNELEAQFKHVGKRWAAHSGLKRERWKQFLSWFVYLYNKDKIKDR